MQFVRNRLSWLAVAWLALQCASFATPIAGLRGAATEEAAVCSCPGSTAGHQCPMHHSHAAAAADANRCAMRSALTQPDSALLGFAVGATLPPGQVASYVPMRAESVAEVRVVFASRSELPEFPPPRS